MASSLSRSLCTRPLSRAAFSSNRTAGRSASTSTIPPESPRYVDVPQPAQPQGFDLPRVKGVLPRPRRIFHNEKMDKSSEEYLGSVQPLRTADRPVPLPEHQERIDYRERLTEMRRKSLREGMRRLKQRQVKTEAYIKAAGERKRREEQRAVSKVDHQTGAWTQPTVLSVKEEHSGNEMSAEEIAERKSQLLQREATKAEERRVNLHTLYMNARDFIVTEDQLNKKVDEIFDAPFYQNKNDPSIWAEYGFPERVADLTGNSRSRSRNVVDANSGQAEITRQRLQRVAEELTGGKMEDPNRKTA